MRLTLRAGSQEFELHPVLQPIGEGVITEADGGAFVLDAPGLDAWAWALRVEGRTLTPTPGDRPGRLQWNWSPGFHAGTVSIELLEHGTPRFATEVTTDPALRKLTRSEYHSMLGDIFADTLALLALTGHRVGFERGDTRPPGIARILFLAQELSNIERAVREIDSAPHTWTRFETHVGSLGRLRRVRPVELARAAPSARAVAAGATLSRSGQRLARRLGGRLPERVRVRRARHSNDRREHREMLGALCHWRTFLARAIRGIEADGTRLHQRRKSLIRRCRGLVLRIRELERLSVFEGLLPKPGPLQHSHLYQAVGPYKRFHRSWRAFSAGLAQVCGDFLSLPLQRTFDLYEQWAFLRLLRAAVDMDPNGDWGGAFSEKLDATGLTLQLAGRPFSAGRFTLAFQESFHEAWTSAAAGKAGSKLFVGSYSRVMRPDITVRCRRGGEQLPELVVLDTKYRVEQQLEGAISELHKYRDAIVEVDSGLVAVAHAVAAAFVIAPRSPFSEGPPVWRDDKTPRVYFRQEYQSRFRFGVVVLRPGHAPLDACREVLQLVAGDG